MTESRGFQVTRLTRSIDTYSLMKNKEGNQSRALRNALCSNDHLAIDNLQSSCDIMKHFAFRLHHLFTHTAILTNPLSFFPIFWGCVCVCLCITHTQSTTQSITHAHNHTQSHTRKIIRCVCACSQKHICRIATHQSKHRIQA